MEKINNPEFSQLLNLFQMEIEKADKELTAFNAK